MSRNTTNWCVAATHLTIHDHHTGFALVGWLGILKVEAHPVMSETTPIPVAMALAISLAAGILVYMIERPNSPADHDSIAATSDSRPSTAALRAEAQTGAQAVEAHLDAELGAAEIEVRVIQDGVAERVVVDGKIGRVAKLPNVLEGS